MNCVSSPKNHDDVDDTIEDYLKTINGSIFECPIAFWKTFSVRWPLLSNLALKLLGIPASSASVERMFNISGHIFSVKRRTMGIRHFENLVFLKLNENFLD